MVQARRFSATKDQNHFVMTVDTISMLSFVVGIMETPFPDNYRMFVFDKYDEFIDLDKHT